MEELQRELQSSPANGFRLILNAIELVVGHCCHGSPHIGSQPLWRLIGELGSVLQHCNWEIVRRHGGEIQAESFVDVRAFLQSFANLLQARHPGLAQMTVLQQDPRAISASIFDHLLSTRPLPLPQRDLPQAVLHVHLLGEPQQHTSGVSTRRQHEHNRCSMGSVRVDLTHGRSWKNNEAFTKGQLHILSHPKQYLLRAEALEQQQLVEVLQLKLIFVIAGKVLFNLLRRIICSPVRPRIEIRRNVITDRTEMMGRGVLQCVDKRPLLVCQQLVVGCIHRIRRSVRDVHISSPTKQQRPLRVRELSTIALYLHGDQERKQQLVALEQSSADILK
mmetsp:Transcript_3543/g.8821  ORF Transcript_3543/g.8821 Transcript_3543/m.8821 type:complete len:334 (+) Transcript_3543:1466-2467(+)